jgi:hypothetical protein
VRFEGGRQVIDGPALRAHARQQEDRSWHQISQALEQVGAGGAGDRADRGEPGVADVVLPEVVDEPREALVQRAVPRLVLDRGRAGIGGADEDEHAGAGLRERFERVLAEKRVGGEGVGAEAVDGAVRALGSAHQCLGVGGRGHWNVAALAVGHDEQAGLLRRGGDRLEGAPAHGAEPLEAGQLRLDGNAGRPGGVDGTDAVLGDRSGREESDLALVGGLAVRADRAGPELGGVGIEPEADLAAALLDEPRQPVGECGARALRHARTDRLGVRT